MIDHPKPPLNVKKVQCWIFSTRQPSNQRICLLLKTNAVRGSFWQPVTGSVELNEGFYEAACREPAEETGFLFVNQPQDTKYEFEYKTKDNVKVKERVFGLFVDESPTPKLDPKEHQDYQWVVPHDALKLLKYPSNLEGLRRAYRLVFREDLIEGHSNS